jgi:hypothetical protein
MVDCDEYLYEEQCKECKEYPCHIVRSRIPLCTPIKDWTTDEEIVYLRSEIKDLKQLIKEKEQKIKELQYEE